MSTNDQDQTATATAEAQSTPETAVPEAAQAAPAAAAPAQSAPPKPALEEMSGAVATDGSVSAPHGGGKGIQMLMDVDLTVTAELGRTRMTIGEILNLSAGSIITLGKAAGEMVDLRVNDKLLASGEVIVVDGQFAVKITKLLSKEERVKNLS